MNVKFSKMAVKSLSRMVKSEKLRIKEGIEGLPSGDVKPLAGSGSLYRLRVGSYRVVFSYIGNDLVYIEKIAPRGDVYKGGLV